MLKEEKDEEGDRERMEALIERRQKSWQHGYWEQGDWSREASETIARGRQWVGEGTGPWIEHGVSFWLQWAAGKRICARKENTILALKEFTIV
jgi:hypothetical protein